MVFAYEHGLFMRATCGQDTNKHPIVVGWVLLTGMHRQKLQDMTEEEVAREGYPGKSKEWFLNKEFRGVPLSTDVWVVSFVLLPVRSGV